MHKDANTLEYFQQTTPSFSVAKFNRIRNFIIKHLKDGQTVADIGCGNGDFLSKLACDEIEADLIGVDIAPNYLALAKQKIPRLETVCASVADKNLPDKIGRQTDFAVIGSVLHHVVGKTRRQSFALAKQSLQNAYSVVKPGGYLLVQEPTYSPAAPLSMLFYVKRFISTFTARRVPLGSYNNNIGAPVVSYLSHEQFVNYCRELGGELVLVDYKKRKIGKFWRIVGMKKRGSSVVAIKKPS